MKRLIQILILSALSTPAFASNYFFNWVHFELANQQNNSYVFYLHCYFNTCAPPMVGFNTSLSTDTVYLNVYYNSIGQFSMIECYQTDTINYTNSYPGMRYLTISINDIRYPNNYPPRDTARNIFDTTFVFFPTEVQSPLEQRLFRYYPNPVKDRLNIQLSSKPTSSCIRLIDVFGKVVLEQPIFVTTTSINMNSLSPGIYSMLLFTNGVKQESITIQKE